jgi:hypothetical protein
MPLSWKTIAIPSATVFVLAGAVALLTPSPAAAQCGSQTSSCQNCHEVQAQMPVNTKGAWHVSHAFGDFCQFCHAGNVQATDAEAAHQGMVEPLADPSASCGACHPTDVQQLAQVYGTALGVQIGSVVSPPAAIASAAAPTPTATPSAAGVAAAPAAVDTIDYNELYAETVEGKPNTGNLILGALIAVAVIGGGGYVLWNERRRRRGSAEPVAAGPSSAAGPAAPEGKSAEGSPSPSGAVDPADLLPAIAALDPVGRRGLEQLLQDPQTASDLLRRLARLDPEVIRTLRGLDRETRALLLALTSD